MNSVNKTLYIPLYGKAMVSRRGIILEDKKAERIWEEGGFPLKGKAASKWLAYYMGMRSAVFDRWLRSKIAEHPNATVLHLGCGLDSRVERVGCGSGRWYDVDFPDVIRERQRFYQETDRYQMLAADLREEGWLRGIAGTEAVAVLEGVSMYLSREELEALLAELRERFERCWILMDVYTEFAARVSRYKNPINEVGVTEVFGLDDPGKLAGNTGIRFLGGRCMTPEDLIGQLNRGEQILFRKLYAGSMSRKLYRLYEFEK